MEKLGLVLSGGGAKGAYEIGVYKALKKLNKKIDIVTGTLHWSHKWYVHYPKRFKRCFKIMETYKL